MKNKLKLLMLSSLMLTSIPSLSSCGKSRLPDFEMPEGGFNSEEQVEIKFFHTMGKNLTDVLDSFLPIFKRSYPNITVNHQQIGSYDDVMDQLVTQLSAGKNDCNVAYCYADHLAIYNKNQSLVTLDTLIDDKTTDSSGNLVYGLSDATKADYIDAFYNEGKTLGDGKMYMLPWTKSSEVMYYDKTFFTKHNLSIPTHWFSTGDSDKTSMEYVCKTIKSIDPNSIPLGYDSDSNWFITMCEQYGSDYTSNDNKNHYVFDNQTNRDFISKFTEWYGKGYVTTKGLNGTYTSSLFTSTDSVRCYMSIGSTAGASNQVPTKINGVYPFEVDVAQIPQVNPERPKVISQGPSVCIFRDKDPQKVLASWLFIRYFTTYVPFQAQFSMISGYSPVIKSVEQNETYSRFLAGDSLIAKANKQCLAQKDSYFTSNVFPGSATARSEVGSLLSAAISGSKTLDKAFTDAINECQYKG